MSVKKPIASSKLIDPTQERLSLLTSDLSTVSGLSEFRLNK